MTIDGLPLLKPPYGTISAVSMDTGKVLWTVANGETPESVSRHPALRGLDIPRTGRDGFVAPVVTKSLLVVGEPSFGPTPDGARGAMLRAYDKTSGAEVGAVYMPAPQTGSPISYMHDGRQYIVLAISGAGYPGAMIAYRLPDPAQPSPIASDPRFSGVVPKALERSVWDGVYSDAQASRGRDIYASTCAPCHGGGLEGLEMAPPLSGISFGQNWNGQPLQSLHDRIVAMPPQTPGIVSADEAADVLSFILQRARIPAGDADLTADRAALSQIEFNTTPPN
jgi:mono/diheme cytochrome c family protein